MAAIGILGLGTYLPPDVRKNEWWPREVVQRWTDDIEAMIRSRASKPVEVPEPARMVFEAMSATALDPFRGAQERHVLPMECKASEMEIPAAEAALADAGVTPDQIDFILTSSWVPDYISVPTACAVHRALGAPERCLAAVVDGACNSFAIQFRMAQGLIASGGYRCGLLVQSQHGSAIQDVNEHWSAWHGDGAAAEVVGPVSEGRGLLSSAFFADGQNYEGMVIGVKGKRWFEEGRCLWHERDHEAVRRMLASMPDRARTAIHAALESANLTVSDVDFYASHQPAAWFRGLTQKAAGLTRARSFDTFPLTGTLSSANIPMVLYEGRRRGLLHEGDVVVTFAGGSGETWAAMALRWGR